MKPRGYTQDQNRDRLKTILVLIREYPRALILRHPRSDFSLHAFEIMYFSRSTQRFE
jgi:hypothetical protein